LSPLRPKGGMRWVREENILNSAAQIFFAPDFGGTNFLNAGVIENKGLIGYRNCVLGVARYTWRDVSAKGEELRRIDDGTSHRPG